MGSTKIIDGNPITDSDPLQVAVKSTALSPGQAAMAASSPVVIANDQSAVPEYQPGGTLCPKNADVSVTNASTSLIAAVTTEKARWSRLRNTGSVACYVAYDEAATTGKELLGPGETIETGYLGAINAITASGTATVHVRAVAR